MNSSPRSWLLPLLLAASAGLAPGSLGCGSDAAVAETYSAPDRKAGDRTPLSASCDPLDGTRCSLPWPSSAFTRVDAKSATGLRVAVDRAKVLVKDDPWSLNLADGFSRATPIAVGFPAMVSPLPVSADGAGSVRLLLAQADLPAYGAPVPMRFTVTQSDEAVESLVVGYPLHPLEANADYVGVVMDDLALDSGPPPSASHVTRVALGLEAAESAEEAKLHGYHAPTRALLAKAGIDPAHVIRVWDFTTRSQADATMRLHAMEAATVKAVTDGAVKIAIDQVVPSSDPNVAVIVEGRLVGLPLFASLDLAKGLTLDDALLPVAQGVHDSPFRVLIPKGTGDYRYVMYGHGLGGSFHDDTFDSEFASHAMAKVNLHFFGWTMSEIIETFVNFSQMFIGAHHSSSRLMQAVADGEALQRVMLGALGDVLAAPTLGGAPNPAAGRRPQFDIPVWTGGSLGGTMGLVFTSASKESYSGVLNVPGAGWTHFVTASSMFGIVDSLIKNPYGGEINVQLAVAMSQNDWDDVDGAIWATELAGRGSVFLVQESIGDPVLPNIGSDLVAVATGATQIGKVLSPIVGVSTASVAAGETGVTQYHVTATDPLDIHGFAARDTPAGKAARDQMQSFLVSVYDKKPAVTLPAACVGGSCDFTGM